MNIRSYFYSNIIEDVFIAINILQILINSRKL